MLWVSCFSWIGYESRVLNFAICVLIATDRLFSKSYPIVVINSEKSLRQHVSSESSIASNHGVSAMPANNFPDGQSKEKRKKPRKEGIRTGK